MVVAGQLQEELSIGTIDSTPSPGSSMLPHDLHPVFTESSKPWRRGVEWIHQLRAASLYMLAVTVKVKGQQRNSERESSQRESLPPTSPKVFSLYRLVSCSDMSKSHLFLRLFLRFCLFFSCLSSFTRSSSDSSSQSCSSRLIPCTFSTAICTGETEGVFSS